MKENRANNNNNRLKRSFELLCETSSAPSQPCKKRGVLTDVTNVVQKQDTAWRVSKVQVVDENSELRKKIELEDVNSASKKDAASKDGSTNAEERDAKSKDENASSDQKPSLPGGESAQVQHEDASPENTNPTRGSGLKHTDIDEEVKDDPQSCTDYVLDIYQHLRKKEKANRPIPNYLEVTQKNMTGRMRAILVDWLVEVAVEYKLLPDTLYLAVNYIDRYLSKNYVPRGNLQLLGVTCMLIASKYEELCPPPIEEFCYITDNTYTREEVVLMESKVLHFLAFELTAPTPKIFLRRFIRASQAGEKVPFLHFEFLANYLTELTLLDWKFLHYVPSLLAAASVFLARLVLNKNEEPWNSTLEHYTGYKASDLKECVMYLYDFHEKQRTFGLKAIKQKYSHHKFKCVACLPFPIGISDHLFRD